MTTMTPAAVYARFSSDSQRDASIEDQVAACRDYAKKHHMNIVATFSDSAMTGTNDRRPGLQRMLKSTKDFDILLVWAIDRLHRNQFDAFATMGRLRADGVEVVSVTQPELSQQSDVAGLLFSIYSWRDAKYSTDLSKNVTRGMRGKAERCQYLGYQTYGYSHDGDRITVDPEQAAVVRKCFAVWVGGGSLERIGQILKQNGHPIAKTAVRHMLSNEKYRGVYVWNDVRVEGGMPRIVDDATWYEAQRRGERQAVTHGSNSDYLLAGKLVCAECGSYMHGESAKGGRYRYYCCLHRHTTCFGARQCGDVDASVAGAVRDVFGSYESTAAVVRRFLEVQEAAVDHEEERAVEKKIKECDRRRDNLVRAISVGIPAETVAGELQRLTDERRAFEARLDALRSDGSRVTADELFEMFGAVSRGELSDAALVSAFVSAVYLYEDRVVIATRLHGASPELEEITALMKKGPNTNPQLDDAAGPSSGVDCLVGQIGGSKYRVVVADRYVATVVAI